MRNLPPFSVEDTMMHRVIKWLFAAAFVTGGIPTNVAFASPPSSSFVPTGDAADAPAGFVEMCSRDRALCLAGLKDPFNAAAMATPALRSACATGVTLAPAGAPHQGVDLFASFVGVWTDYTKRSGDCGGATQSGISASISAKNIPVVGLPLEDNTSGGTAALARRLKSFGSFDASETTLQIDGKTIDEVQLVRRINSQVNRQIVQVSDLASRGVEEEWDRPGRIGRPAGDCEDIAIEKRVRLLEAGFPPDKLFFAVVYRANFGLHTILVARLLDGDYVLDSARSEILRWSQTHYAWLRAQSTSNPLRWARIAPQAL